MNALRAWLAHLWRVHVALAERITPMGFAWIWAGVAVGALLGAATAPDPDSGLALTFISFLAVCMGWANFSGRIHP